MALISPLTSFIIRTQAAIVAAALIITATTYHGTTSAAKSPPSPPGTGGIAPAPAKAISECFRALVNTSDCLSYVKSESNLTKPEKGCCSEMAGLVESNPICLCELLGHPEATGFAIDVHKALNLPSLCGVPNAPNVTSCSAAGVPVSLAPISQDAMSPSDEAREGLAPSPSRDEGSTLSYLPNEDDEDAAPCNSLKDSTINFILGLATAIIFILNYDF